MDSSDNCAASSPESGRVNPIFANKDEALRLAIVLIERLAEDEEYDLMDSVTDATNLLPFLRRVQSETSPDPVICGCCGELVSGPCDFPDDPCGLYTWPPIDGDAKQSSTLRPEPEQRSE